MAVHKLFIKQTNFNGITYSSGAVIDTLASYNIVCRDFPFKLYPDAKEVVTKNWRGSHGLDAYIPTVNKIKDYDIDVEFLYCGVHANMRTDIDSFLRFLNGMEGGRVVDNNTTYNDVVAGARLAVYDQYTQIGRKDLRVASVEFGGWWDMPDFDTDAIADFKVRFHVFDPVTNVLYNQQSKTLTWT